MKDNFLKIENMFREKISFWVDNGKIWCNDFIQNWSETQNKRSIESLKLDLFSFFNILPLLFILWHIHFEENVYTFK